MAAKITDAEKEMETEFLPGQSAQVSHEVPETQTPQDGLPPSMHSMPERGLKWPVQSTKMQVTSPTSDDDNSHEQPGQCQEKKDGERWVAVLRTFINVCQPYFNFLESTARTLTLSSDTERAQLLAFSQEMCEILESLVLTFASRKLLTLDETDPDNMSHFCIGQIQLDALRLSVTVFRYCKPMPYLARLNTGMYKRMRWNVEGLDEAHLPEIKFYYLCYEDVPNLDRDGDKSDSTGVRLWSIGQWVHVGPGPSMEDILDWLLCDVPAGAFEKLLFVGEHEPSSCQATDQMLQLLTSREDVTHTPRKTFLRMSANDSEEMAVNLLPGWSAQVRHRVRSSARAGLEVAAVRSFTSACQPYFNFLESTARTMQLPPEMYVQLMEFSQQMCDTLERLILSFASTNLLTLDESDPNNMSHFCIGQIRLDHLRLSVTAFRYCQPTPYLARVDTGVFKRMRWNVTGLDGESKSETEYYFLCYEDTPNMYTEGDGGDSGTVRLWSIGQWVQVKPDPNTEDIFDWVLCDVPEGAFQKLLFMGSQEPSSCTATDHLLQLLLHQSAHPRAPLSF